MVDVVIFDQDPRIQYTAAAAQTVFDYPFIIFEEADLKVYLTPVGDEPNDEDDILILNVDYTVTDVGAETGGTIVLTNPATAGDIITIVRDVELVRS